METLDITLVMRLFKGSPFPRTVSTYATRGRQILVNSTEEIYEKFEQAKFVDCRINAFPVDNKSPDFVMADLDLSKFRTERMLIKALDKTVSRVNKDLPDEPVPMVLFTGGGYHIYQPIDMSVLEEESIFRFFDNPSSEFIRYAAQRWTDGKNDTCNNPSVRSCLLRVPGSINSKNRKTVEIVQEWNGKRPTANRLLQDFYIKSASKKLRKESSTYYEYYAPTSHHFKHKTYRHYGHMPRYPADPTTAIDGIAWIDTILANGAIADYRKTLVDLVLAPYLVNVKQCDYDDAYSKIIDWLNKCGHKRSLDFNAKLKVSYALKKSKQNRIRPMRLDTIKIDYPDMYHGVVTAE
jgi:hypothetical protein